MRRECCRSRAKLAVLAPTAIVPASPSRAGLAAPSVDAVASAPAGSSPPASQTRLPRPGAGGAAAGGQTASLACTSTGRLQAGRPGQAHRQAMDEQSSGSPERRSHPGRCRLPAQLHQRPAADDQPGLLRLGEAGPDLLHNIQDGVRVVYDIPKLKLNITVDYAIKEEPRQDVPGQSVAYLQVTLPEGAIQGRGAIAPTPPAPPASWW